MKELGIFLGVMVTGLAFTLGLIAVAYSYECNGYQVVTGKETKFYRFECYIKDDGKWFAWDEYKFRYATKGGF